MTAKIDPDAAGESPRHTVRVPAAEWAAALEAAELNGENVSVVVRAALRRYVARTRRQHRPTEQSS